MTAEILVPENHNGNAHQHDPYTTSGARSVLRRFRDDVIDMLVTMEDNNERFEEGKTMLSQSPLARKIWVAAAMKTMGLVEERPTENGACGLVLTPKAIAQMEDLKKYL